MNDQDIPDDSSTTHLGILRNNRAKLDTDEKINKGRRTAYSLLGAGFHGRNGLKQDVKAHIWNLYVVPRMLYGIETLPYTESDLRKLDNYQTRALKQIQHLPDRAANVAASALLGVIPLSSQVHLNTLNLFYTVIQDRNSTIYQICERQLAVKVIDSHSFTSRIRRLLLLYDLPDVYSLISEVPEKMSWKNMLTAAVHNRVEEKWKEEIQGKSSLKYLNPDAVRAGSAHPLYSTVRPNTEDTRRAENKARLLTGTYTLQSNRAVFNQYKVDPSCRLCEQEAETREHFIAECTATEDIREEYSAKLNVILTSTLTCSSSYFTQLILDCTHPTIGYQLTQSEMDQVEMLSRQFIEKLHNRRNRVLAQLD